MAFLLGSRPARVQEDVREGVPLEGHVEVQGT